jgi:hypothetical protein
MSVKERKRAKVRTQTRGIHLFLIYLYQFYQEDIVEQISSPGSYGMILVRLHVSVEL